MSKENLSEVGIRNFFKKMVNDLRNEIEPLQDKLRKAELALDALEPESSSKTIVVPITNIKTGKPSKTLTLAERAGKILNKVKTPLTSRELLDLINSTWDDRQWGFKNFSGRWSHVYRDKNKPFKVREYPENPNEIKFFYGLKIWFIGDDFKEEYRNRLIVKHRLNEIETLFKT